MAQFLPLLFNIILCTTVIYSDGQLIAPDKNDSSTELRPQMVNGLTLILDSPTPVVMLFVGVSSNVTFNYTLDPDVDVAKRVLFSLSHEKLAEIDGEMTQTIDRVKPPNEHTPGLSGTFDILLHGHLPGRAMLMVSILDVGNSSSPRNENSSQAMFPMIVMRMPSKLDMIFQLSMMIFVAIFTCVMGMAIDLRATREMLRRPKTPAAGIVCQLVIMPLIAFALAKSITFPNSVMSLGLFAAGCCPGGGASNFYAYLLGGDVSLSVAMTAITTILSIGTFPMWIFTLGRLLLDDSELQIPYVNMVQTMAMIAIPLLIGVALNYKFPVFCKKLRKIIAPFLIITVLCIISLSMYMYWYIFQLFTAHVILAGCLLPYFGYFIGGLSTYIIFRSWKIAKTIAIETGIQNVGIAFFMLIISFPPPDGELGAIPPMASAMFTPVPLLFAVLAYQLYRKFIKKKPSDDGEVNSDKKDNEKTITNCDHKDLNECEPMIQVVSAV